jgi:hypothetical protein
MAGTYVSSGPQGCGIVNALENRRLKSYVHDPDYRL